MPTLQIDSRQHKGKHFLKHDHFEKCGIHCVRTKLYVGDYMYVGGTVSCDTKASIQELNANVCSAQHKRFRAECDKAREAGIQLVILTENTYGIENLSDLMGWLEPASDWRKRGPKAKRIKGWQLAKACSTIAERHGALFGFCHPANAGRRVLEILEKGETYAERKRSC